MGQVQAGGAAVAGLGKAGPQAGISDPGYSVKNPRLPLEEIAGDNISMTQEALTAS